MTADEVQTLIDDVPCDLCNAPSGLAYYMIAAALIDLSQGNAVPDTTQELITEANCLLCLVSPGLLPFVMIQAIRGISSSGGAGGVLSGVGAPVADPGTTAALYIDTATGALYMWYGSPGSWH